MSIYKDCSKNYERVANEPGVQQIRNGTFGFKEGHGIILRSQNKPPIMHMNENLLKQDCMGPI